METNITYENLELLGFEDITSKHHKSIYRKYSFPLTAKNRTIQITFDYKFDTEFIVKIKCEIVGMHTKLSDEMGPNFSVNSIEDIVKVIRDSSHRFGVYDGKQDFHTWLDSSNLMK